ncbi:glutathione peroxidase [Psychrobacillus sp. FSL W7-1457]|uniref:glutathione peroxidase n=1 Tax=unclassified Psychrobacillus TaxID=2636677 RepID=UPI00262FAA93|nr:glutathione peroxidase [uncultured Psychrobacillus sp.]
MSIYDFDFKLPDISGNLVSLEKFKGNVVLIVNTASKCGFTYQYEDLQKLYARYKEQGFVVLGFPSNHFDDQEPGSNSDINQFCKINFGVQFPMFSKVKVRDQEAEPLFNYLTTVKPFKGFNNSHPSSRILSSIINEKVPHYMQGNSIKWNFTKFLLDRNGNVLHRYESTTDTIDMEKDIEALL